ncbi:MAG: DNA/RNA nuclease SfsA [Ruminococcus sp.]
MKYKNIHKGKFISRPNRFIAEVEIDGVINTVHVKNTGRCKELLTKNATVFLEKSDNPLRKTQYDLVAVYKGDRLINMDSQAPNIVFGEYLKKNELIENVTKIKPEHKFNNSRFDFYVEAQNRKIFAEVKGVTLEEDNIVMFPDAPTERGLRHIQELIEACKQGYEAYCVFIVQMNNVKYFTPNVKTQPEFAQALINAQNQGVNIIAYDCIVTENSLEVNNQVKIIL